MEVSARIDRRQHHRFLALLEIRILTEADVPADLKLATLDIGFGGARCASSHPLLAGKRLRLQLSMVGLGLSGPVPIELDAAVLRCVEISGVVANRRFEVALQFVRIDPRDRKRLQDYLSGL